MNTAQMKLVAWSSAGVLGVGLALYMVNFARHQDETKQLVKVDEMKKVLTSVKLDDTAKDENQTEYELVKKGLVSLTWVGRPKEVKVEAPVDVPKPLTPDKESMSKLVKVVALYYDPSSEMETRCVLKYTSDAHIDEKKYPNGRVGKRVGDKLEQPLDYARVVKIDERGVEFAFDDEKREHELLRPSEFDLSGKVRYIGENGTPYIPTVAAIPRGESYGHWPAKTVKVAPNQFKLGTDNVKDFSENYDHILSEVRVENHYDPTTHKHDGLVLKDIKPGSTLEQYGAEDGDVIKSVNGHPVKSQQEAIQWVKANADAYDKWDVEIENHGDTRIVTIYPPKN